MSCTRLTPGLFCARPRALSADGAMAGPSLGVNVQAAMRGQGIGKGASESRDAEDPPELRIFADPDFATMDIAGA